MLRLIKKYKKEILFALLLVLLFFLTRLYNIMSLPLFTDEAIYVRWSQIANKDSAWRFISLTDGKQPSFVWITIVFMRFFKDPLLAGRLVSVMAGFFSVIGMFFLGKEVFKNRWVGLLSSLLYVLFPMALVYDRMALYDSLVGMFTIWSLYLEVVLIRTLRLDVALILALVAGGATLTKTNGFFTLYLLPFSLLLFNLKRKEKIKPFLKWVGMAVLVVVLVNVYYSVLRLSPFFHTVNDKNGIFVYSFKEWLDHPVRFLWGNLLGLWDWFIGYTTWPIIFLIAASFVAAKQFFREKALLFLWFVLPFVALALFGKVLYPRFILFMVLPLLPLAAFSIYALPRFIPKATLQYIVAFAFILLLVRSDFYILTNFSRAPIPGSDLEQFSNSWPAGAGVREIVAYLKTQSDKQRIYVGSEGTFGSLPTYAMEIYLGENTNIEKEGIWPLPKQIPHDIEYRAGIMPTYFIFNDSQTPPPDWPVKLVAKYQKGTGNYYMSLYQVLPK